MSFYAGIGSRETPDEVITLIRYVADRLSCKGYGLRSGNAPGADQAFADGHLCAMSGAAIELFLPWANFEHQAIKGWTNDIVSRWTPDPWTFPIAEQFHPAWDDLSAGAKKLQARNVHQILGPTPDSDKSRFVVCWTPGGKEFGGTGQALRIAKAHRIPICNLGSSEARNRILGWLDD